MLPVLFCFLGYLAFGVLSSPYDQREVDWNLNTNQQTLNPLEYSGEREGHVFTPSPENWRFPFYTLILDRFVNGDPTNDDNNGTVFEHDSTSNQLKYGGDLSGLVESLDYLQGMGIKVTHSAQSLNENADREQGFVYCRDTVSQLAVQIRRLLGTQSPENYEHAFIDWSLAY